MVSKKKIFKVVFTWYIIIVGTTLPNYMASFTSRDGHWEMDEIIVSDIKRKPKLSALNKIHATVVSKNNHIQS